MSENNKNKILNQLLDKRLNQSAKKREATLSKIDAEFEDDKKSGTISSSDTKKQKIMKVENPYGTPNPNPKEVTSFDYDDEMSAETDEKNQTKDTEDDKNTNKQILDRDIPNSNVHVAKNTADATSVDDEISNVTNKKQTTNNPKANTAQVVSQQDTASLNQEAIDMAGEEELRDVLKRDKEWDGERKKAQMEQLQNKLTQVRDDFVTKKRRTETLGTKLKSLLGTVDIGNANAEIKQFEDNYNEALADVRDVLLQERDVEDTSEERKREINAELKFMAINEGIALNDAETKAKLETKWGKVGDKIHKVGMWYKGLPKGVKYTMAGALVLTGGAIALSGGATGVGGGLFILAKGGKRALGAVAAGVGAGAALEARVKGKRDTQMAEEMKKFSEMSLEEQNAMVAGIDKLDEETQKEFEKIRSQRRKIKFAAVGVAASLMALGAWSTAHDIDKFGAGHATVGAEHTATVLNAKELAQETQFSQQVLDASSNGFTDDMQHTEAFEVFQKKYGPEAFKKFLESDTKLTVNGKEIVDLDGKERWWARHVAHATRMYEEIAQNQVETNLAHELAQKMGIDSDNLQFTAEGHIPTEINGHLVPEELLTDKQRKMIETVRHIRNWTPNENHVNNVVHQSKNMIADDWGDTDTSSLNKNVVLENAQQDISHLEDHSAGVHEGVGTPWLGHEDELREGGKPIYDNDHYINAELTEDAKLEFLSDKQNELMHQLAQEMGVDDPTHIEFNTDFTEINGHPVSKELLLKHHNQIETLQSALAGDKGAFDTLVAQKTNIADVAKQGLSTENGPSDVVKGVISKEGIHDWEKMSGGVNKYGITAEQLQNARELPINDRDKMEEYLIKLAKTHSEENSGEVNVNLLKQEADKAFTKYELTGEIPNLTEPVNPVDVTPDTGVDDIYDAPYANENINVPQEDYSDNDAIESRASMQADASDVTDNPTQEGILYDDNDAIENQAGVQSNASEMVDNPTSQGFNHIEMSVNNIGTLTIEKGSSIEGTLTKFLETNSDKLTEGGMGWDADDPRWGGDVHKWASARAHGLAQEFADKHSGIDLDMVQPNTELNLNLSNPADIKLDVDFEGGPHIVPEGVKTEILGDNASDNVEAKVVTDTVSGNTTEATNGIGGNVVEETPQQTIKSNPFEGMTESEILQEFVGNRNLKIAVAKEMMDTFNSDNMANVLRNIAPMKADIFLNNGDSMQAEAIKAVRDRAIAVFGENGAPKPNTTVGNYFTRIFTKAIMEGKLKEVFPTSNFEFKK